ncbi:MAG: 2OG-Fe(II) oxygenase, partial [Gemmataceae bacterium]
MTRPVADALNLALRKIDRPGTFCCSGGVPAGLPGLTIDGVGPVAFPLLPAQAAAIRRRCEPAPYGKGEETLVDPAVRRVWRLKPDGFTLAGPGWDLFVRAATDAVQEALGLGDQKLTTHLYELLLYEPGSFFLPHKDGEKLDRMVATLVVVLPSQFEGGELVVRHDGQERVIDLAPEAASLLQYAAFYADCEHEVRPLRSGHRLCVVYNLTLAKSKKRLPAPRLSDHADAVSRAVAGMSADDAPRLLAYLLEHEYTADGLAWDALKGVDRTRAEALRLGAARGGCHAHLALVTYHESGAAEYVNRGGRRRYSYYDEYEGDGDPANYTMGEIYDESLMAGNWSDPDGRKLPLGEVPIEDEELVDPEQLKKVKPEEEFEGYTGNAGMTIDRWYRHAAVVIWADAKHYEILCAAGSQGAAAALAGMVEKGQKAGAGAFAGTIIAQWKPTHGTAGQPCLLFRSLKALDDEGLIVAYLRDVLPADPAADPGGMLIDVMRKHGWATYRPKLEAAFAATTAAARGRNVALLEAVCTAKPGKKPGWAGTCAALSAALVEAVIALDAKPDEYAWRQEPRTAWVAGLLRGLIAGGQDGPLERFVEHALGLPKKYALRETLVPVAVELKPWLAKHLKKPNPGLSRWLDACREQLEEWTAKVPQPPADFRRPAEVTCKCADCAELKKFLGDPAEAVHRFRRVQGRRSHLEDQIR